MIQLTIRVLPSGYHDVGTPRNIMRLSIPDLKCRHATQRSRGALRDDTKNGCAAEYPARLPFSCLQKAEL